MASPVSMNRSISFDSGPLANYVKAMVETSPIASKIEIRYLNSLIDSAGEVMVVEDRTRYRWSTGEELFWSFLSQVSGRQTASSLGEIAAYFRSDPDISRWMAGLVTVLFGVYADPNE